MSPGYNTLPEWEKPKTGALPYVGADDKTIIIQLAVR